MGLYRKRPIVIQAIQLPHDPTDEDIDELAEFLSEAEDWNSTRGGIEIHTLEGTMLASEGDFIIRGVAGEFYPCKPDIFWATYEEA